MGTHDFTSLNATASLLNMPAAASLSILNATKHQPLIQLLFNISECSQSDKVCLQWSHSWRAEAGQRKGHFHRMSNPVAELKNCLFIIFPSDQQTSRPFSRLIYRCVRAIWMSAPHIFSRRIKLAPANVTGRSSRPKIAFIHTHT